MRINITFNFTFLCKNKFKNGHCTCLKTLGLKVRYAQPTLKNKNKLCILFSSIIDKAYRAKIQGICGTVQSKTKNNNK